MSARKTYQPWTKAERELIYHAFINIKSFHRSVYSQVKALHGGPFGYRSWSSIRNKINERRGLKRKRKLYTYVHQT